MPNLTDLPNVLRRAGLIVHTLDGWEKRTTANPSFHPEAVVYHHDASPRGDSPGVPGYMARNYGTAGAQLWVDRGGEWTVISCNKANHAGVVCGGKPGNSQSFGIETDHTTGEDWPGAQLSSLRRGTVAILKWLGSSPEDLHFHKSICWKPGRKSDPDGLDLGAEREALRRMWDGQTTLSSPAAPLPTILPVGNAAPPAPIPAPVPGLLVVDGEWGPATTTMLQRALGVAADGILGPDTYRALQAKVGNAVDGVFGPNSRRALQRYLGVAQDGQVGPITVRALQQRLNEKRF